MAEAGDTGLSCGVFLMEERLNLLLGWNTTQ